MNKAKIFFLVVIATITTGLSAQAKFSFGPKIGFNVNKLDISGVSNLDASNRFGFTAGLTAEYIVPVIGVGVDASLMYSHMKTHLDEGVISENVSGNFFEIPVHLKYKLGLPAIESILSPYVFTGPSVAFKLSGDDSYAGTKTTQWGWDLGLGVELVKHLQVGAGYTFGINKLVNTVFDDLNTTHSIKVKNNYWTVTAAYMF